VVKATGAGGILGDVVLERTLEAGSAPYSDPKTPFLSPKSI
jgi:hypothetical protein